MVFLLHCLLKKCYFVLHPGDFPTHLFIEKPDHFVTDEDGVLADKDLVDLFPTDSVLS